MVECSPDQDPVQLDIDPGGDAVMIGAHGRRRGLGTPELDAAEVLAERREERG